PHSIFPVAQGSLDHIVGVARAKELLSDLMQHGRINTDLLRTPVYVPNTASAIDLIDTLRQARGQLVFVNDEFGQLVGIVSPLDLLEAIAGEFPDEDEQLALQQTGPTQWRANGSVDLHQLEQVLAVRNLMPEDGRYTLL